MTDPNEQELIALAQAGDLRAISALVNLHQSAVRGFLRRLAGHHNIADDIAQEAFVAAIASLQKFQGRSSFRSFVCGIAYRIWRGQYRSERRRRKRESGYAENAMFEKPPAMDLDLYLSLRQAMETLEPEQRAALALCLGAEFSHAEAAVALGLPLGTIKSHVARGRIKLRQVLGEDDAVGSTADGGEVDD